MKQVGAFGALISKTSPEGLNLRGRSAFYEMKPMDKVPVDFLAAYFAGFNVKDGFTKDTENYTVFIDDRVPEGRPEREVNTGVYRAERLIRGLNSVYGLNPRVVTASELMTPEEYNVKAANCFIGLDYDGVPKVPKNLSEIVGEIVFIRKLKDVFDADVKFGDCLGIELDENVRDFKINLDSAYIEPLAAATRSYQPVSLNTCSSKRGERILFDDILYPAGEENIMRQLKATTNKDALNYYMTLAGASAEVLGIEPTYTREKILEMPASELRKVVGGEFKKSVIDPYVDVLGDKPGTGFF